MSVRLFVGNLPYDVTEAELRELFLAAGSPASIRIPTDRETGKPRGFAFVEFGDAAQAGEAIRRFHQQLFKGRPLVVNEARPREERAGPRSSAFGLEGRSGAPGPPDRGPRPEQPARRFGPDALPRDRRKPRGHSSKGEPKPKGPMRERTGGQFFYGGPDDPQEDQEADDTAFWDRHAAEQDEE
jgi:RNA recognition motif-containing protein